MRAMDVMTSEVITVPPTASVQALAELLSERGISGVPVVDADQRVIGIVSEGDLVQRTEPGIQRRTARRRARWFDENAGRELARDYVKAYSKTVGELMSRDVVTVADTAEVADVAALMETKRIKRVPVIRDGRLVGIITRANLLRALAATKSAPATAAEADDRAIRAGLFNELTGRGWAGPADILVKDGVVHVWVSEDQSAVERQALRIAAEKMPGVKGVEEHTVPTPLQFAPVDWRRAWNR